MKYIEVEVKTAFILHGYDADNKLVQEAVAEDHYVRKIVALERILSVSEQYLLVSSIDGREMFWEYRGSLDDIKEKLLSSAALIQ